jgi:ElaB/YqjD/DUF883 family membrane-anchored ribosome-binding protein
VDDLLLVVQGAEEFAECAGAEVKPEHRAEIAGRLAQLKEGCLRIKQQAKATALAADKVLRQYPYSSLGFAFGLGMVVGALVCRRRQV